LLLPGCDNEEFRSPQFRDLDVHRYVHLVPVADVDVEKALGSQDMLDDDPTYCSLPKKLAGFAAVGDQIRVIRNDNEFAAYTVAEIREQDDPQILRMGLDGRKRLYTSGTFEGQIAPVVNTELSDEEAEAAGEFVERLDDNGVCTGLVVLAPHGGGIEAGTDQQAEYLAAALPNTSSWRCKGWRPGGGSSKRWHITSTIISPNSFPGLATIADRGFAYAVSFHGMKAEGVVVGGGAPVELRSLIRDAIADALDGDAGPVIVADEDHPLGGDSPHNVVNWLTAGGNGGVQLEQNKKVRKDYGEVVAEAVASVFADLV
jgi:phage replication-related protein YjqB (UPF0714/DUF867 family)